MRRLALLIPIALLAACGSKPDASGASPEEQQQLNDAAASIDANAVTPDEATGDDAGQGGDQGTDQGNAQ